MKRALLHAIYAVVFPAYSLWDRRFAFTVFFRRHGAWWARTRGRSFPVRQPGVWALEYYRRFLPPRGGLVLDVGGELGFETEQFARLVGREGRVVVFECFPDHIRRLKEIAARWRNVTVVERACWNASTTLTFFTGHTPGSNTAVPDARGSRGQALANTDRGSISVLAEPLDSLWREHAGGRIVDYLKMDIEGAEYEALDGARELLAHTRAAVIAAYHIRDGVRTADRVADVLRASGFYVEIADNDHVYATRPG